MRLLLIVFSTFIFVKSCSSNTDFNDTKIEYIATTRGYYQSIKIKDNKFYFSKVRNGEFEEILLTKAEWKLLADAYKKIDLVNYEQLVGSTNERDFDKRPYANLYIEKNNNRLKTKGFDHKMPPTEIKPFVELILEYSKK